MPKTAVYIKLAGSKRKAILPMNRVYLYPIVVAKPDPNAAIKTYRPHFLTGVNGFVNCALNINGVIARAEKRIVRALLALFAIFGVCF